MPGLSRSQLVTYAAVAVVLLLVGARWIRSGGGEDTAEGGVSFASESGRSSSQSSGVAVSQDSGDVVIHVTGAVRDPGVYRLPAGSRVNDAVERAGGANAAGDLTQINLAARLSDGQQVVVPARAKGPVGVASGSGTGSAGVASTQGP